MGHQKNAYARSDRHKRFYIFHNSLLNKILYSWHNSITLSE